MELMNIERIHERYEAYMDDYHLSGSYSVHIPFFKVTLQMNYLYETGLTMVEDFICKCIERGIRTKSKIIFVLALDEEIFQVAIAPLVESGYLMEQLENGQINYAFTEVGKRLIEKRTRYEPKTMYTDWYYDGLGDQYKLDFFSTSHLHQFKKYKEIEKTKDRIIITPTVFPKYESELHFQLLARQTIDKIDEIEQAEQEKIVSKSIVNIEHFELLADREVYYHEYRVLVFTNDEGEYKLIAHDLCGSNFVDQQVTESIMQLAEDGYFDDLIVNESEQLSIDEILLALKNYANEKLSLSLADLAEDEAISKRLEESGELDTEPEHEVKPTAMDQKTPVAAEINIAELIDTVEPGEETINPQQAQILEYRESIEKIEQLEPQKISLQYIMNYKIREQFVSYLKNAQKSLYIISPWMNNYIINDEFKVDLLNLLQRGVKVRIICGITDHTSEQQDFRDLNTQKIAKELVRIAEPYGDLFKLQYGQTHEKLLICDDEHYINGSFNFLSYSGGDDKYFRNEGSTYSQDEVLIQQTIKLRFDF